MSRDTEFEKRKKISDEVKKFNRTEQEEMYKILKKNGEEISENKNGMFFDLMNLKETSISKIEELIQFCSENRRNFEMREKEMSNYSASLKN